MKKTAIITGAGSGIGRDFAIRLLNKGYQVALAGRRIKALEETLEMAQEEAKGICISTDVSKPDSVKHLFEATKKAFGRLDLLFNNAGVSAPGIAFEDLTFDQWQQVLNINLTGIFLCSQAAFKLMKSQDPMGGRIINNGSISAHAPRPNSAPYTASKHGVTGLTKSCNLDGRKYNIAVGQIDIGNALTPMARKMQKGVPQADGRIEIEPTIDVGNVGETLLYMAELPLEANVVFLTVMATKMPYIGRG
ncbi:MAG: SDR family oxidoreductase [Bacteroidota bacterium]